jgi:hypothetical protein
MTHPDRHSATSAWRWSGPGLIPLGASSADPTAMTVIGYDLP